VIEDRYKDFLAMIQSLSRFFDIRAGEAYRFGITFALLFLLIAANNLIKIIRDSNFLSHHSVSELSYLYILVALLAGGITEYQWISLALVILGAGLLCSQWPARNHTPRNG
jgi:ATP/ADP translocase